MPVNPNRETCPPGLLAVADLIGRVPERTADLLKVEVERRELDMLRINELQRKLSWHPASTIQLLIVTGAAAFAVSWGGGKMLDFLKLYDTTMNKVNATPTAIAGIPIPSITGMLPTQFAGMFTSLPRIGVKESLILALCTVLTIALIKLIIILINWKRIKLVNAAKKRLTEEMKTLKEWVGHAEVTEKAPKKK